jgi:hypothetical protein
MATNMQKYELATVNALIQSGNAVVYFEHVGVIQVTFDDKAYYVNPIPEIEDYGTDFTTTFNKTHKLITLHYEDGRKPWIHLQSIKVIIHGEGYVKPELYKYIGYLNDNMYTSYKNVWIKNSDHTKIITESLTNFTGIPVLNMNFTPAKAQQVNIKNKGIKHVLHEYINDNKFEDFTAFGLINYFAAGKYVESKRNDLFTCITESGELFALLLDPNDKSVYLASETKINALTNATNHLVGVANGICCGFEIEDDLTRFRTLYNDDDMSVDFRGNLVDEPVPAIYQYGYRMLAIDDNTEEVVELTVRQINGGLHTKVANI